MQKVLEAETLKYGLTNSKIIEKVYVLPKDADANRVLDTARAEEQAQIREVEKIRRDHNLGETESAEELRQQKKPSSKKSKASSDRRTKSQYNCTRCGRKHGPKQCPAYWKECSKWKRKGHFAEQCRSKGNADSSSKRSSKQKQIPGPKKKFHEVTADSEGSEADFSEYDTDEVTVQIDSVEAKTEEKQACQDSFWQETAQTRHQGLFTRGLIT